MNSNHLSAWEQEEYVLDQRTPQMLRHLTECDECRAAVAQLEHGLGVYRNAALQWTAESLATHPQQFITARKQPVLSLRWAMAAVIPIVLVLIALLPFRASNQRPAQPVAVQISTAQIRNDAGDDALLDQVDQQISAAVPSSMESLTHLVSTGKGAAPKGSKQIVQNN
jgi:predicted anti-sigma-YlaC factor YlaD